MKPIQQNSSYLLRAAQLAGLIVTLAAVGAYIWHQITRPDVLLVGNVTVDLVPDGSRPAGGAVTYAAAVLTALGIRACVVTVAGPDADLSVFEPHELHVIPSPATLTFEHSYTWWGHSRRLRVTANPNITISRRHVPLHCQRARLVILGPLTLNDVDAASFLKYDGVWDRLFRGPWQRIAYMAQGTQRQLGPRGSVLPLTSPSHALLDGLGPQVSVFLSDVEVDSWSAADVLKVAHACERLIITQGDKGAEELNKTGVHMIDVVPVDEVRDTNGAGDTFATMYSIAMAWGVSDPASIASYAASRAVQQPQSCKPACVGNNYAHLSQAWPTALKLRSDITALGPHLLSVICHLFEPLQPVFEDLKAVVTDAMTSFFKSVIPALYTQPINISQNVLHPPQAHVPALLTTSLRSRPGDDRWGVAGSPGSVPMTGLHPGHAAETADRLSKPPGLLLPEAAQPSSLEPVGANSKTSTSRYMAQAATTTGQQCLSSLTADCLGDELQEQDTSHINVPALFKTVQRVISGWFESRLAR